MTPGRRGDGGGQRSAFPRISLAARCFRWFRGFARVNAGPRCNSAQPVGTPQDPGCAGSQSGGRRFDPGAVHHFRSVSTLVSKPSPSGAEGSFSAGVTRGSLLAGKQSSPLAGSLGRAPLRFYVGASGTTCCLLWEGQGVQRPVSRVRSFPAFVGDLAGEVGSKDRSEGVLRVHI